ncbi:MBL fold metallo-hydrolase [Luteococcus sediminum]
MTIQTHELSDGLSLSTTVVGGMGNNAYLLHTEEGRAVLVDAADEPDRLRELVGECTVETIITTHRHHDHIQALAEMAERTGARTVCGEADAAAIEEATGVACEGLWTGDVVQLGKHSLQLVGLVGHTPGSVAVVVRTPGAPVQLLTGDALFPGGVGKTSSHDDFSSLLDDVETHLFAPFDDDTVVWPGHGDPTTLGAERPHLDEWRTRGW